MSEPPTTPVQIFVRKASRQDFFTFFGETIRNHRFIMVHHVHHGSSLFIMIDHGSSWFIMGHHGSSWFITILQIIISIVETVRLS
jgi:hypothetical protein